MAANAIQFETVMMM